MNIVQNVNGSYSRTKPANDYDMATVQPLIERATNQYVEMKRFLLTDQCLMTTLLKHFGQESSQSLIVTSVQTVMKEVNS